MVYTILTLLIEIYLLCGLLVAIPFALFGAQKIDPHARGGSWGFRLMIIPGVAGLWPFMLSRWRSGAHEPPEERNAHRCAARKKI